MVQNPPLMKMTRRYGHTVYEVAAYCSPDSKATYKDRLLQLIQHAAEKDIPAKPMENAQDSA